MWKPYQSPGRMKNASYHIAPVGVRTHDLLHTVASNMGKVPHALNYSDTEAESWQHVTPSYSRIVREGRVEPMRSRNHFIGYGQMSKVKNRSKTQLTWSYIIRS